MFSIWNPFRTVITLFDYELPSKITRIIIEIYSKNPTVSHKDPQKTIESVAETIEIRRLQVFTPLV